jgi:hypothetical protein
MVASKCFGICNFVHGKFIGDIFMKVKAASIKSIVGAIALCGIFPSVVEAIPQPARRACIVRTAEEMLEPVSDIRIINIGRASPESGVAAVILENKRNRETATCRVNTIDNTVLSVTMNTEVPPSNFGQRPEFWIVKPSGSFLKAEPSLGARDIRSGIPGNTVFRNLGCQSQGFPTWCEVELRDNPRVRGWAFSTTFSEYRSSRPREEFSPSEAPEVGTPVSGLSDLVGARAGQAENTIRQRGYRFLRSEVSGDAPYSYWREPRTNNCVVIRTSNGRYESIVYGTPACN